MAYITIAILPGLGSISTSLLILWHSKSIELQNKVSQLNYKSGLGCMNRTIIRNPDYLQRHWSSWTSFTWPRSKKFTKLCASVGHILHTDTTHDTEWYCEWVYVWIEITKKTKTTKCDLFMCTDQRWTLHRRPSRIKLSFISMNRFKKVPFVAIFLYIWLILTNKSDTALFKTLFSLLFFNWVNPRNTNIVS